MNLPFLNLCLFILSISSLLIYQLIESFTAIEKYVKRVTCITISGHWIYNKLAYIWFCAVLYYVHVHMYLHIQDMTFGNVLHLEKLLSAEKTTSRIHRHVISVISIQYGFFLILFFPHKSLFEEISIPDGTEKTTVITHSTDYKSATTKITSTNDN